MENPEIMYEVRQGTNNIHGAEFEKHTTNLSYCRCEKLYRKWKQDNTSGVRSYFVANNVDHVGAFDDVVVRVEYPDGGTYKTKMMFVQCKHFLDPNKGSLDKILNSEITKLFDSFVIVLRILDEGVVSWDKHNKKEVQKYLRKGINEDQWKAKIDKLKAIFKCYISDCEFFLYSNSKFDDGAPENAKKTRCDYTDIPSKILKNATGDLFEVELKEKYLSKITYENFKHFSVKDFEFLKKEFSKRFRIYVNQHDKTIKDIDQLIKPEIDRKEFLRLLKQEQQYIYQTAMSSALTENSYLTDILESFYTLKYQSRKMLEKFLVIPNSKSLFTNEAIQSLKRHLSSECATKISTPFLQLEKLKILQMFITEMKEENLFIYIKDAEDLGIFSTARKLMSYKHLKNILVCSEIANSFSEYNKEVNEIFIEIHQISANQTTLDEFASDFSVETIQFIQNYKVMFQGLAVTLNNIFEQRWRQLVDENMILKIFRKEEVVISRHVLPPLDCYLQRILKVKTLMPQLHSDVSKKLSNLDSGNKYFVLSEKRKNIPRRDASMSWFHCISEARKFMREIEREIRNDTIHLCSQCEGKIILLYSFGEKNDDSYLTNITENEFVVSEKNMVSIITGPAGMGKSSTLLSLAHLYKSKNKSHLVYFIELNKHLKELKAYKSGLDLHSRIEFVASDILNIEKHNLEHRIFFDACENTGNVAIFFDAFDEISPDGEKNLTNLLESLEKSRISRIFVSSRPNYVNTLEKAFDINGIHFSPFDKNEMECFLLMFLGNYTKETKSEIEVIKDFVNCILKSMGKNNGLLYEFLSIPLQLKMLADVYFEKFSEMNADKKTSFSIKMADICGLYNAFIEKLVERYLVEKKKLNLLNMQDEHRTIEIKNTMRDAEELACKLICPDINQTPLAEYSDAIVNMCNQVGLITNIDPPVFLHRTYGEFLAANWFIQCILNKKQNTSFYVSFLCKNILLKDEYREIRRFINAILCNLNSQENDSHIINPDVKILVCQFSRGTTSLHVAAEENHAEILKLLVINDPSMLNKMPSYGYTAADIACQWGNTEALQYLLSQTDSTLILKGERNDSILHFAAKPGNLIIINLIMEKFPQLLKQKDSRGCTALHYACDYNNTDVVKLLLSHDNCQINVHNNEQENPLHYSSKWSNLEVMKMLLDRDISLLNIQNIKGQTPLHLLILSFVPCYFVLYPEIDKNDSIKALNYLLSLNCSVNVKDINGKTPLHLASMHRYVEIIKLLLERDGTLLNQQDKDGRTPLHCVLDTTVKDGYGTAWYARDSYATTRYETVSCLLNFPECDINLTDNGGNTPLHLAARRLNYEFANDSIFFFHFSDDYFDDDKLLPLFIQRDGLLLNVQNTRGQTALHLAAESCNFEDTKVLLSHKECKANAQDKNGDTPLHSCIKGCRYDEQIMIKMIDLIKLDSSLLNIKNQEGQTPLHEAVKVHSLKAIDLLVQLRADVNIKDNDNRTPLELSRWLLAKMKNDYNCNTTKLEGEDRLYAEFVYDY